ncbi:MAG TPA: RNase adapter RapZ [Candidatus Dormibacteraeota bacterium]|jgi:UPF0042 nucleotide-binding protein|nr:RNase adapter RapZ [Candidatus Dormibacteraeota bacterium]
MPRQVMLGGEGAAGAAGAFQAVGCEVTVLGSPSAVALRELDRAGRRYVLVHVGDDDGESEGSYERAHHRIQEAEAAALAERLRPRDRKLVRCLAFGYKQGMPEEASVVVDTRFLDNPYWVEELRPLDGRDAPVSDYVLAQEQAVELLDRLESDLSWLLPRYQRDEITVALGCTGGRHRSVAMAAELARRLGVHDGLDVRFEARDLD